jgi:hypothetical protein
MRKGLATKIGCLFNGTLLPLPTGCFVESKFNMPWLVEIAVVPPQGKCSRSSYFPSPICFMKSWLSQISHS